MRVFDSSSLEFSEIGTILFASSKGIPNVSARLGDGSASIAITLKPFLAKYPARVPETSVFPTPPFPETAIFTRFSPFW